MGTENARFERVRELFDRALELPAAERPAFVAASAAGDDALTAEVLSLLSALEAEPEMLERPAIVAMMGDNPPEALGGEQPAAGAREIQQEFAAPIFSHQLHVSLRALPTTDSNDNESVLCYRSYFPAARAGV